MWIRRIVRAMAGVVVLAGCTEQVTSPRVAPEAPLDIAATPSFSATATTKNLTVRPSTQGGAANNLLGVTLDAAPGYPNGSFAANASVAGNKSEMYFPSDSLFGVRDVTLAEVATISYWTKTGATHAVDPRDWYLVIYTKPYAGDLSTPT